MKSKVGILTINDYNNYGNRLQNYALQEVLRKLDVEVETIVNQTDFSYLFHANESLGKKVQRVMATPYVAFQSKYWQKKHQAKIEQAQEKRQQNFHLFTNEFIKESRFVITEDKVPKNELVKYDYFVTGSDQVWNPYFRAGSFIDFLTFAPRKKRIAYAPSFGVSDLPEQYRADYTRWLQEINALSVREAVGADIIKGLTGREVPVLADPTLLLTKEEWQAAAKPALNRFGGPYLLTYFLGSPDAATQQKIKQVAKAKQLRILELGNIYDLATYPAGPSEFIDYIEHAELFFTNSFHGVVFSIIFETPFLVYEREAHGNSLYSRIETILDHFTLHSREGKGFDGELFTIEAKDAPAILALEHEKSQAFLAQALGIEG